MITVHIGGNERPFPADQSWVTQQIKVRGRQEENICLRFIIQEPECNIVLSKGKCNAYGPSTIGVIKGKDRIVIDLWNKFFPDEKQLTPGRIIAFQNQLVKLFN